MTPGVVTFSHEEFVQIYPQFIAAPGPRLASYFRRATRVLNNTESSVVQDVVERKDLLFLIVAHIATLESRGSGIVGQLINASEGSVSSQFSAMSPGKQEYWSQTQYGLEFWEATRRYRSFIHV